MVYDVMKQVAQTGHDIGQAVSKEINNIPRHKRGAKVASVLKPEGGANSRYADAVGEEVGFEALKSLSVNIEYPISVIVNPQKGEVLKIGYHHGVSETIFCYFDAVDGTIKVAGLGSDTSDPENEIHRVGNNGAWATGIAFTDPTDKNLSDLFVGDFKTAALVDGNPRRYRASPINAVVFDGVTYEIDENTDEKQSLFTSSQKDIGQGTVSWDMFQALDLNTAPKDAKQLALDIYGEIIDRNKNGPFDIVRLYGSMSEILEQFLETRIDGIEPQGVGSLALNENLPNLVPITPIVEGAGGYVVGFDGHPIRHMKLTDGRPNVIIASNETILESLEELVNLALA